MDLETILDARPPERRDAVASFLDASVGEGTECGRPVSYSQPRQAKKDDGVRHLDCSAAAS